MKTFTVRLYEHYINYVTCVYIETQLFNEGIMFFSDLRPQPKNFKY